MEKILYLISEEPRKFPMRLLQSVTSVERRVTPMSTVLMKLVICCLSNVRLVQRHITTVALIRVQILFSFPKTNRNVSEKGQRIAIKSLKKEGLKTLLL